MLLQGSDQSVQRRNCSLSNESDSKEGTETAFILQLLSQLVESLHIIYTAYTRLFSLLKTTL